MICSILLKFTNLVSTLVYHFVTHTHACHTILSRTFSLKVFIFFFLRVNLGTLFHLAKQARNVKLTRHLSPGIPFTQVSEGPGPMKVECLTGDNIIKTSKIQPSTVKHIQSNQINKTMQKIVHWYTAHIKMSQMKWFTVQQTLQKQHLPLSILKMSNDKQPIWIIQ